MKKNILFLALALYTIPLLSSDKKTEMICQLFHIGAIKTGEFRLKSGMISPIYIDMRSVISHPKIFLSTVNLLAQQMHNCTFDHVVGVPYAALPFASGLALLHQRSMIMPRKEIKDHGTRKAVEGVYHAGQSAIIIEDVITTGGSILEIVEILKNEGIYVRDAIVFIDREQGGRQKLADRGIRLHAVCTLTDIFTTLHDSGLISAGELQNILSSTHQ